MSAVSYLTGLASWADPHWCHLFKATAQSVDGGKPEANAASEHDIDRVGSTYRGEKHANRFMVWYKYIVTYNETMRVKVWGEINMRYVEMQSFHPSKVRKRKKQDATLRYTGVGMWREHRQEKLQRPVQIRTWQSLCGSSLLTRVTTIESTIGNQTISAWAWACSARPLAW